MDEQELKDLNINVEDVNTHIELHIESEQL